MLKYFSAALCLLLTVCVLSCKGKRHVNLSGEDQVVFADLLDSFPQLSSPYLFADTSLLIKKTDTVRISQKVFHQFVPDSVSDHVFGKKAKVSWYPVGKMEEARKSTYLLVKGFSGKKKSLVLLLFDHRDSFQKAMVALLPDKKSSTRQAFTLDDDGVFTEEIWRRNPGEPDDYGKKVYDFNADSSRFRLIMVDPLDETVADVYNPIDSLSQKQKYTADYGTGKRNIVSFRDGRREGRLQFFIHIESRDGKCDGEIRGVAVRTAADKAEFHEPGNPCGLVFSFSSKAVTVKEITGCGNRRGLNCSFDGTYPRKRSTSTSK